jgi:hypothetical protein
MPKTKMKYHLEKVYTKGGHGVAVVIDHANDCFFQFNGDALLVVAGMPKPNLDGGAYAEEPHWVSPDMLADWESEGWIGDKQEYRAAIERAFAEEATN